MQAPLKVDGPLEEDLFRRPIGFTFGDPKKAPRTGWIDPILMEGDVHLITIAPTGAGRGVGGIVPALLRFPGPVIVVAPRARISPSRRGGGANSARPAC